MPIERTLGVLWNTKTDSFEFENHIQEKPPTRRGILSAIASIYDPLGYLAVITLKPKRILQELSRLKLGWDEKIPDSIEREWRKWLSTLVILKEVRLPRCFVPLDFGRSTTIQLHHFSDASQYGMGVASYLRFTNGEGRIHCILVFGKSRVSPMKTQSIPRLELNSAVMAVRINEVLTEELELVISRVYYWTDSTTVLRYIQNESKRFQVFVSNKVSEIHDGSDSNRWNYIDTKSNPADDASRSIAVSSLHRQHRWFTGPDFLWLAEKDWPTQPNITSTIPDTDPELKRVKEVTVHLTQTDNFTDTLFKQYSSRRKLISTVAWLTLYVQYLKQKSIGMVPIVTNRLTVKDRQKAETKIIKLIQNEHFASEILDLQNGKHIDKKSKLVKLKPMLSDESLLCVGGRLQRSELSYHQKHQIILPNNHFVTDLLVRECHEMYGHSGRNHVLSILRQRYWILNGKTAVRRVLGGCMDCLRFNSKTASQPMADLPSCRVMSEEPVFTRVGVDLFGPFNIKQGRSTVKRYVCIFTCLQIRAVHFEILYSLESSSFINGFRRFISRRGTPMEIRSDRGTNFIGAEKELRDNMKTWNMQSINSFLQQKQIDWKFNPAAASHHGGIWERLIRSTRNVLRHTLKDQLVTDETFLTVILEAESILNSRPLDECSDDPDDLEPINPNQILLLRPNQNLPPGVFHDRDSVSRKKMETSAIFNQRILATMDKGVYTNVADQTKVVKREA